MSRGRQGQSKTDSNEELAQAVRARLHSPVKITLQDIARELGVPERTLRRLFRDRFAISPGQYQLAVRLNLVKKQLQLAITKGESVSEIAARQGFLHMGRFSAQYRRLFGETPSQTRQGLP